MSTKDSESRKARKEFEQCHNCLISKAVAKRSLPVKLRECTGCHTATYCSRACQRAHWKAHKPRCEQHQQMIQTLETRAERLRDRPLPGSDGEGESMAPIVEPQDILEEISSWKKHFRPVLFQAGFNALDIINKPHNWKHHVVLLHISRLDHVDQDSKYWTRYSVLSIEPMHLTDLGAKTSISRAQFEDLMEKKYAMDEQNTRHRVAGTIAFVLNITCPAADPGLIMNNVTYMAYYHHKGIKLISNWAQEFTDSIERMCERKA